MPSKLGKPKNRKSKSKVQATIANSPSLIQEGELRNVAIAAIDFSPFNYRKFFSKKAPNPKN